MKIFQIETEIRSSYKTLEKIRKHIRLIRCVVLMTSSSTRTEQFGIEMGIHTVLHCAFNK
uniref:Uncharacterized protein n=1 Tax=Arion vulgaris TaxID=1028688 RepID=A0A0B7B081_9EUPU